MSQSINKGLVLVISSHLVQAKLPYASGEEVDFIDLSISVTTRKKEKMK